MAQTKVLALNHGNIGMDIEIMVSGHPKYLVSRSQKQKAKVWCRCPSMSFIVEHPEGRILFDTSISSNWEQEWRHPIFRELISCDELKPEEFLEARLKQLGLGPEDFKYIIISHLHTDHAGNLRLFQKAGGEIIVHEDELKGALSMESPITLWGPGGQFGIVRGDFVALPRKATPVYGDQELLSGVRLLSLPGHTWGTLGLMVKLKASGWFLLASDAVYHHESYGPPPTGSITTLFADKWLSSIEKVRRLARSYNATVVPGHDDTVIISHPEGDKLGKLAFAPDHIYR